jgi:hypothetical protein
VTAALALLGQVGGLALKNWKLLAIGLLAMVVAVQSARLDNAKREQLNPVSGVRWKVEARRDAGLLKTARADLKTCQGSVVTLKGSLASQNAAVEAWKGEAARRDAAASVAAQDARKARAVAESRARDLAAWKSAPTCPAREAAVTRLVEGLIR